MVFRVEEHSDTEIIKGLFVEYEGLRWFFFLLYY